MSSPETPEGWSCDFRYVLNKELDRFDGKDVPAEKPADKTKQPVPEGANSVTQGEKSTAGADKSASGGEQPPDAADSSSAANGPGDGIPERRTGVGARGRAHHQSVWRLVLWRRHPQRDV